MNSVFLLIAALPVFFLGYRFYSKLVDLGTFRLDPDYATPAREARDEQDFVPAPRYALFSHHVASISGGTTIIGVTVAVIWGWVPGFLWIVTAVVVGAGTYGMAALWLSLHRQARSPAAISGELLGPRVRPLFFLLALVVLLILGAVLVLIIAQVLTAHPEVVIPFWLQIPVALGFGRVLRREPAHGQWLLLPVAIAQLSLLALGGFLPFAVTGVLEIRIGGLSLLRADSTFLWLALVLVYAIYAVRLPVWKLARPRGCLSGVTLGLALVALFAGIAIRHPDLVAPAFNPDAELRGAVPWLFILLTGGAIAGFHGLLAAATARHLPRETDARPMGYGSALVDGLLGVGVLTVSAAAFGSVEDWRQVYSSWDGVTGFGKMVEVFITGFAHFVSALGLSPALAASLGAFLVASLALSTLETGLRVQKQLLAEIGQTHDLAPLRQPKTLVWLAVALTAAVALFDGQGRGGQILWPLFGATNQILGGLILLLVVLALVRRNRSALPVLVPLLFLIPVATWALGLQVFEWWIGRRWIFVGTGLGILALQLWVLYQGAWTYRRLLREAGPPQKSPPI